MENDNPLAYKLDHAAFKLGRTVSTIRKLVKDGFITATWIGGVQMISHDELVRVIRDGDGVPSSRGQNSRQASLTRWHGKGTAMAAKTGKRQTAK